MVGCGGQWQAGTGKSGRKDEKTEAESQVAHTERVGLQRELGGCWLEAVT